MSGTGSPAKYEIINKYSFKIIFDKPYGAFIAQMAIGGWRSYVDVLKPKHYLKQYHIKYTSLEKIKPLLKIALRFIAKKFIIKKSIIPSRIAS